MKYEIQRGEVFIITAPSGTGKTSLLERLLQEHSNFELTLSYTSRSKRENSKDTNYKFVSEEEFRKMIDEGKFVEYTEKYGNLYGTPEFDIQEKVKQGKTLFFEVEWQGAREIRRKYPNAIHIYFLPINREILRLRIFKRGSSSNEEIDRRMNDAFGEMSHFIEADYLIFNDDFDEAYTEFKSVVTSEQLRVDYVTRYRSTQLEKLFNQDSNIK